MGLMQPLIALAGKEARKQHHNILLILASLDRLLPLPWEKKKQEGRAERALRGTTQVHGL